MIVINVGYWKGTHVAGKVAGKVYGVAKAANIQSVKILNKTGDGKLSTMLKGKYYSNIA